MAREGGGEGRWPGGRGRSMMSSKGAWPNNRLIIMLEAAGGGGRRGEGKVARVGGCGVV